MIKTGLGIIVLVYVLMGVLLYVNQRSQIYFFVPALDINDADRHELQVGDIALKGWVLNEGRPNAILYFGGNAENVGYNIPQFAELFSGYTVYLLNYRGYGGNEGVPTEADLYRDALRLYDQIKPMHANVSVIGRSLGSGVASYLSSMRKVHQLVLITPFDSIRNIAQRIYWMYPINALIKDKYDTYLYAGKIKAETLIILAENDGIIPRGSSDKLVAEFNNKARVFVVRGATHNTLSNDGTFYQSLDDFFE